TPLIAAVVANQPSAVQYLLQKGAQKDSYLNAAGGPKIYAVDLALKLKEPAIAYMLVKVNAPSELSNSEALASTFKMAYTLRDSATLQSMLNDNPNLMTTVVINDQGQSLLDYAQSSDNTRLLTMLDPYLQTPNSNTVQLTPDQKAYIFERDSIQAFGHQSTGANRAIYSVEAVLKKLANHEVTKMPGVESCTHYSTFAEAQRTISRNANSLTFEGDEAYTRSYPSPLAVVIDLQLSDIIINQLLANNENPAQTLSLADGTQYNALHAAIAANNLPAVQALIKYYNTEKTNELAAFLNTPLTHGNKSFMPLDMAFVLHRDAIYWALQKAGATGASKDRPQKP
ncbi:MAG TPA: hypothetical protein PLV25_07670, partial [Opitutales bacterium]|nr:hypothetical protein [Opitutales bacterium]